MSDVAAPTDLKVQELPLSALQQEWIAAARRFVRPDDLRTLLTSMVNIPSPTGEEAAIARFAVDALAVAGVDAEYQPMDARQANAIGRLRGSGGGASLLLYAPLDTVTTGNPEEDCPGVGPLLRDDMLPAAVDRGSWVVGLGASNPKGHAACVIAAAQAVARAGLRLPGDVLVGLGAGGMPTNRRDTMERYNAGQGSGCSFMLEQGVQADFAVIAKPGWAVAWEEVGLCWFRVRVHGLFNYVGSRHRIAYRNPVVDAARVILALERWAAEYTTANTSGLVAPQAQIGAVSGGWSRMPSFSAAVCELWLDVRTSPRTPPMNVRRQFAAAIDRIRAEHPDLELSWEMTLSIAGTTTPPDSWIVQSTARAWQAEAGRAHQALAGTSGATDANILRARGIPTARVGMPKAVDDTGAEVDFALGMNAADIDDLVRLTRLLITTIVDTCGRSAGEVLAVAEGDPHDRA
jgi:acetylornithine deacetylase/succinyl-diaminopimelate desuccinylase-like protein